MEQAKAKATSESTQATSATTNTTTMLMASEEGKLAESMDSKCSEQLSTEIKRELSTWEQSSPGIAGKFTAELRAGGFSKLTDLTTTQAQKILTQVSTRNAGNFFQQSLEKTTA